MNGVRNLKSESGHGTVVLATYSRPELLKQCLESIYSADLSSSIRKVIIVQGNNPEVLKLVQSFADYNTTVIPSNPNGTPLQCINANYWMGFEFAFKKLRSEWVLCLEEDSVISKNAYSFISQIHSTNLGRLFYRGINLGSLETGPGLAGTYSLLRMGFNGNAGVLTRKTWKSLISLKMENELTKYPFDGATRYLWRTGYVVAPNLSMYMNYGWIKGTHVTADVDKTFFIQLEESWNSNIGTHDYCELEIAHSWGQDVRSFRYREQPRAILFYILYRFLGHDAMHKILMRRHRKAESRTII